MSSQEGKYRKMVTKNVSSKIVDKIKQLQAHSLPTFPSFPEIPSYEECMRRSKEFWENFTFFWENRAGGKEYFRLNLRNCHIK